MARLTPSTVVTVYAPGASQPVQMPLGHLRQAVALGQLPPTVLVQTVIGGPTHPATDVLSAARSGGLRWWWLAIPIAAVLTLAVGTLVLIVVSSKPTYHVREATPTSTATLSVRSSQPFTQDYRIGAAMVNPEALAVPAFDTRKAIEADGEHHVRNPHALAPDYSETLTDQEGARRCRQCSPTDHVLCAQGGMHVVERRSFFLSLDGQSGEEEFDEVEVVDGPDKGKRVFVWVSELTAGSHLSPTRTAPEPIRDELLQQMLVAGADGSDDLFAQMMGAGTDSGAEARRDASTVKKGSDEDLFNQMMNSGTP